MNKWLFLMVIPMALLALMAVAPKSAAEDQPATPKVPASQPVQPDFNSMSVEELRLKAQEYWWIAKRTSAKVVSLEHEIEQMKKEMAELRAKVASMPKPEQTSDEIELAIKHGRLTIGMTLSQANRAMSVRYHAPPGTIYGANLRSEDETTKTYDWSVGGGYESFGATFRDGKIIKHWKH